MSHTPGPWRVENSNKNGFEVWANHTETGSLRVAVTGHAYTFDQANANLIASAPDLLAALEAMVEAYCPHRRFTERDLLHPAVRDSLDAIAKARGET